MATASGNIVIAGKNIVVTIATVDVGFTKGGVRVNVANEILRVKGDQVIGTIKTALTDRTCTVSFTMLEQSLPNLRNAWNLAAGALVSSSLEVNDTHLGEVAVVFVGSDSAPNGGTRTVTFPAAVAVSAGELSFTKEGETVIEVTFEAIWNVTLGAFFSVVDAA